MVWKNDALVIPRALGLAGENNLASRAQNLKLEVKSTLADAELASTAVESVTRSPSADQPAREHVQAPAVSSSKERRTMTQGKKLSENVTLVKPYAPHAPHLFNRPI